MCFGALFKSIDAQCNRIVEHGVILVAAQIAKQLKQDEGQSTQSCRRAKLDGVLDA